MESIESIHLDYRTADEIRRIIPDWSLGSAWIDDTQTFGGSGLREPREAGEICLTIVPLCKGQPVDGKELPQSKAFDTDYAVGAYMQNEAYGSYGFVDIEKTTEWITSTTTTFPEISAQTIGFENLPVVSDLHKAEDLLYEMNNLLHIQTSDSVFGIGATARESWRDFAHRISLMPTAGDAQNVWADIDESMERAQSRRIEGRCDSPYDLYVREYHTDVSFPVDYSLTLQKNRWGGYAWEGDLHIPFEDSEVTLTNFKMQCSSLTEAASMTQSRAIDLFDLDEENDFWIPEETETAIIANWKRETEEGR